MPYVTQVSKKSNHERNRSARTAYLAGREWVRLNKDNDTVKRIIKSVEHDAHILKECWEPPTPYTKASSMELNQRWKWYRHHLLVTHQVDAYEYVRHQVGLLTALQHSQESFYGERMKERFLATRFLQLKPLPKHGKDIVTKRLKQHEPLEKKAAKFISNRLLGIWSALSSMTTIERELPLLINKTKKKRVTASLKWTGELRDRKRESANKQFNQVIGEMRCMTTGAVFGKTKSGKLKVLYRGAATPAQIERMMTQGG